MTMVLVFKMNKNVILPKENINTLRFVEEKNRLPTYTIPENETIKDFLASVLEMSKDIANAEKHARGMKSLDSLRLAKSKIRNILSKFNVSYDEATRRQVTKPVNICPDEYKGTTYGNPLFLKGFEEIKCDYGKPLYKLITIIVVYDVLENTRSIEKVLMSLNTFLPGVKVIASVDRSLLVDSRKHSANGTVTLLSHKNESVGALFNNILKFVKTEYTLFANDVTEFDEHVRLERLIRELERLRMGAASGAIRNIDGKWRLGCYQRAFRNYTVSYFEGYDESIHECLVCDHIEGPFIMRTHEASKLSFDENINGDGLFEDFFIRLGQERSIVCPDSMFHVHNELPKSNISTVWTSFAKKYDLVKLRFNPGPEILFPCSKSQKCFKSKYYVAHPCCLWELADMVKSVMYICDKAKAICEIFAGTLMASIKLGQVLPWDIDGDVSFMFKNISKIEAVTKTFKKYKINHMSRDKGGYFELNSRNWFIECWGEGRMTSEEFILNGKGPTKVYLNGAWINTNKSPGLHTRNRYGHEFLRHAVHWRYTGGKSSWLTYKSDSFPKCDKPGDHKCVDNFRNDGNLQFSDPLP